MKRFLVIIDGSVQSSLALDQALDIARATTMDVELLLLQIEEPGAAWQRLRPRDPSRVAIAERVAEGALYRARAAGVTAEMRKEAGDAAEVATRVAIQDDCDHIFLPDHKPTPMMRAIMVVTGLGAITAASRIQSRARVPVTVVGHESRSNG